MNKEKIIYSLERCSCGVPDACSDCSYNNYLSRICVQHLTADALKLIKDDLIMKWEDFVKNLPKGRKTYPPREQTNIECPICRNLLFKRNDIILTSYPEKYQYECSGCGWIGYAYN